MNQISRRSALSMAVAATAVVAGGAAPALAQGSSVLDRGPGEKQPPGITIKHWGKRESWIPGYKSLSMVDVIFQPGAKHTASNMPCDMACHIAEGQLLVTKKAENAKFTAKMGDVWTCRKGDDETTENTGKTVAIMRSILLMA
jgi:quercetin dioxygenase-like cupin family protein